MSQRRPHVRRNVFFAVFAALLGLVLTACLGPDEYDPTGNEPIGRLDVVQAAGTSVRVAGWAIDPNTTQPVVVRVEANGRSHEVRADLSRPDVAAAHRGYGPNHGFDFTTPSLGAGKVSVCAWIPNVGPGYQGRLLGCPTVVLKSDDAVGRFESFTTSGADRGRIVGWALEPEIPHLPTTVQWSLNGGPWKQERTTVLRLDVNWVYVTSGTHGFSIDLPLPLGRNEVCMRVPSFGRGAGATLGCRTFYNDRVSAVVPGRDLLTIAPVGPGPDHPLHAMSRDAGVSTILGDGSVMWFFGDTSENLPTGGFKYFLNNTAARAVAGSPLVTIDAVGTDGRPVQSFTPLPTPAFDPPCPDGMKGVLWPMSAVTVPSGDGTDDVFAYLSNMCLGRGEMNFFYRGVSVARYRYDPAEPPTTTRPVVGEMVAQNLFSTAEPAYGTSAVYMSGSGRPGAGGGFVYVYQCAGPRGDDGPYWPDDPSFGPCTVGRVPPSGIGDRALYEYFSGDGAGDPSAQIDDPDLWVTEDVTAAGPMDVAVVDPSGHREMPVSAFTVVDDPYHGFLMVYSPWPGLTDEIVVRRGSSPIGPWGHENVYRVPGCDDSYGGVTGYCYAATAQPALSAPDRIGIGYYDQIVGLSTVRGSYLAGTVAVRWPFAGQ